MKMSFLHSKTVHFTFAVLLINAILFVNGLRISSIRDSDGVREKRGAAYAGGHPGGGYGQGGVGIPGLNNVIQYSAYNTLLNSGNHGQSSGYGRGSSHGRKLTVDQAIGMFGHHTQNQPYPYTAEHGSGGGASYGSSGSGLSGIIGTSSGYGH